MVSRAGLSTQFGLYHVGIRDPLSKAHVGHSHLSKGHTLGLPEYLEKHSPPRPLVRWIIKKLNLNPTHGEDPALWFAGTCAAAFCDWAKTDPGVLWLFGVNGVRRIDPGPWDLFTILDEQTNRRRSIKSDTVFSWDRARPLPVTGPIPTAAEAIRFIMKRFDTPVPREVVPFLNVNPETTKQEFQGKVALLASKVAGEWFVTDEARAWAHQTQSVLRAVYGLQELVYSQHLVPIGTAANVEHTRKQGTEPCEECWTTQPCVEMEREGNMCRRCAGYTGGMNGAHNVCEKCDITDCPHWKEFFGNSEKQEWLLSAAVR